MFLICTLGFFNSLCCYVSTRCLLLLSAICLHLVYFFLCRFCLWKVQNIPAEPVRWNHNCRELTPELKAQVEHILLLWLVKIKGKNQGVCCHEEKMGVGCELALLESPVVPTQCEYWYLVLFCFTGSLSRTLSLCSRCYFFISAHFNSKFSGLP